MSSLLAVLLALAALFLGPLLSGLVGPRARALALLDGFVLTMVGGLCLVNLLPEAYIAIGAWAFPIALLGLLLPQLAERGIDQHRHEEPAFLLLLALAGLLLHAAVDGASLAVEPEHGAAMHEGESSLAVSLAILLHRLPVGLFVWWSVRPKLGNRLSSVVLALLGGATLLGYGVGQGLHELSQGVWGGIVVALLSGGLLHIVSGHGALAGSGHTHRVHSGLGALIGLMLLLPVASEHHFDLIFAALQKSGELLLESGFAIVLGFLGAGLLSLVPTESLARLMRGRNPFESALRGVIFGLPLPVCSCGVVPLYRSLARKSVPPAAALAFLVATPELGLDAVIISLPLLGWKLALLRILAAIAVAMIAGLVASLFVPKACDLGEDPMAGAAGGSSLRRALRYGFVESLDDLGPWILAGLLVAGFLEPLLSPEWILRLPRALEVPLFAALGTPLYLCASGATPVAAVLLAKGVGAGAILAFLIAGPATNITTFGALRATHSRLGAWVLVCVIPLSAVVMGLLLGRFGPSQAELGEIAEPHGYAPWRWIFAGLFGLLLLASLLRQGPRGFLHQLGIGEAHDQQADDCGDDHCH